MSEIWGRNTLCLVTGASQGIGREIAIAFSSKFAPGSKVLLMARSEKGLTETKLLMSGSAPAVEVEKVTYDLSKPDTKEFKDILSKHKSPERESYMLIHNAGTEGDGQPILDLSNLEDWQTYMSVNVYSVAMLSSAFLSVFPCQERIFLLNITSLAAIQPIPSLGQYCVSKAAREMYFRMLAAENPAIKVLNYSPGPVATEMVDRVIEKASNADTKASFSSLRKERQLLQVGETVGRLVRLLASPNLPPSGGRVDYFDKEC